MSRKKYITIALISVFCIIAFIIIFSLSSFFIKVFVYFYNNDFNYDHLSFSNERLEIDIKTDFDTKEYYPFIMLHNASKTGGQYIDKAFLWCEYNNKAYFIGYENRYILIALDSLDCIYSNDVSAFAPEDAVVFNEMDSRQDLFITSEY